MNSQNCCWFQTQVPAVDEGRHVRRDPVPHVSGGPGGSEFAAHGKDREQVPLAGVVDLGVAARERAEVSGEVGPVLDVGQHVEHAPCATGACARP